MSNPAVKLACTRSLECSSTLHTNSDGLLLLLAPTAAATAWTAETVMQVLRRCKGVHTGYTPDSLLWFK
jgi:hypothetical protein